MTKTDPTQELDALRSKLTRREEIAQVREEVAARRAERRATARRQKIRRKAVLTGQVARTRHAVYQSGEARAQRVATTRTLALCLLIPVLCAFGGWSAAGVQAGMVATLGLDPDSAAAAAAWLVEPALIGIVAGVILIRAQLQSAGGDLDQRATRVEFGALALSILLNIAGHWPSEMSAGAVAALAGHALGPIGAAGTAYLISVVQDGVTRANPWTLDDGSDAPSLVESTPEPTPESASESTPEPLPTPVWETAWNAPESALKLPLVALPNRRAITAGEPSQERSREGQRSMSDQDRSRSSGVSRESAQESPEKPARKPRTDKGRTLPSALKSAPEMSPRKLSDDELADRLTTLQESGELAADAPVSAIQRALGTGFERAKRVIELRDSRPLPGQLNLVDDTTAA